MQKNINIKKEVSSEQKRVVFKNKKRRKELLTIIGISIIAVITIFIAGCVTVKDVFILVVDQPAESIGPFTTNEFIEIQYEIVEGSYFPPCCAAPIYQGILVPDGWTVDAIKSEWYTFNFDDYCEDNLVYNAARGGYDVCTDYSGIWCIGACALYEPIEDYTGESDEKDVYDFQTSSQNYAYCDESLDLTESCTGYQTLTSDDFSSYNPEYCGSDALYSSCFFSNFLNGLVNPGYSEPVPSGYHWVFFETSDEIWKLHDLTHFSIDITATTAGNYNLKYAFCSDTREIVLTLDYGDLLCVVSDLKPITINPCIDMDNDGYGANGDTEPTCPNYPNKDCNDNNATINPGAIEICDGLNNDCNAATADGSGETWYESSEVSCSDSYDNDCDGTTNCADLDDCATESVCCIDNDLDDFGDGSYGNLGCAELDEDCDDAKPNVYPGNTNTFCDCDTADGFDGSISIASESEFCSDGEDNDCNGLIDCADVPACPLCTSCGMDLYCISEMCVPAYYDEAAGTCTSCAELLCTSLTSEEEVANANEACDLGCIWDEELGHGVGGDYVVIADDCSVKAYWSKDIAGHGQTVDLVLEGSGDGCSTVENMNFYICNETFWNEGVLSCKGNTPYTELGGFPSGADWIVNYTKDCTDLPYNCVDEAQEYHFVAEFPTKDVRSGPLIVLPCDATNDADCDGICDTDESSDFCVVNQVGDFSGDLCDGTQAGSDTEVSGCTQGQSTCVAKWDCTAVEWRDCDEETGERTRSRENCDCTPEGDPCCTEAWKAQIPEVKSCIIEEEFPVFNFQNFISVIFLLVIFYVASSFKKNRKERLREAREKKVLVS